MKSVIYSQMLKDNFYVINGLAESDNLATAIESQQQLMRILTKHRFNCRKWSANRPLMLQNIPLNDRELHLNCDNDEEESINTLGLLWLPKVNHFCIKVKMEPIRRTKKRSVCSNLAKLFDRNSNANSTRRGLVIIRITVPYYSPYSYLAANKFAYSYRF